MNSPLTLHNVRKRFAEHVAVDSLSLSVPEGTIYGILGPNGAGKSTTLRMILNIIARDAGEISLLGRDPAREPEVLKQVGYLPEERGLYRKMRVMDTIVFFAELKGVSAGDARRLGREWLERIGLAEWEQAKVETLSKGMQQKVQFITTVLHSPRLLILDEPFSGLDPVNQEVLRDTVLQARAEGHTVLFSTHIMEQAERICDHLCSEPHGALATALSWIPFTAPLALPLRMGATEIAAFEIVGSLLVLILTIALVSWLAGKIYRVGMLSTGKRTTLGDLWQWVRTA